MPVGTLTVMHTVNKTQYTAEYETEHAIREVGTAVVHKQASQRVES